MKSKRTVFRVSGVAILLILLLALVNAYFFSRIRISPIVGYLLTGCLVGPFGLHLVSSLDAVDNMAEIGVILLLFTIGLEFSFRRILMLKELMFKSGTTQILLSGVLIFAGAVYLEIPFRAAIVIGFALAISSTAIVLRILQERGEVDSAHGRTVLAIRSLLRQEPRRGMAIAACIVSVCFVICQGMLTMMMSLSVPPPS